MGKNNKTDTLNYPKILEVLREIGRNPQQTQRVLAQRLEISLGKINFIINALIDKGIIEVKNFKNSKNKAGYMYLLTPKGINIKIDLTRQFLVWKMQEYEKLRQEIEALRRDTDSRGSISSKDSFVHKNYIGGDI